MLRTVLEIEMRARTILWEISTEDQTSYGIKERAFNKDRATEI
jgi:hypothetical protein